MRRVKSQRATLALKNHEIFYRLNALLKLMKLFSPNRVCGDLEMRVKGMKG